jgi:hypothetical protein
VLAASIIRAMMMMEAASTSGTSANFYQTTRRNNPEDSHLQKHHNGVKLAEYNLQLYAVLSVVLVLV